MNVEKFGLTIFDILGYLLPGYIVLFGISVFESTFLHSTQISLIAIGNNPFLFTVIAYFLGIICHWFSTSLKGKYRKLFSSSKDKINPLVYNRFIEAIAETYNIHRIDDENRLHTLDNYLLADSYILTEGCGDERMSLMVREGFFKTSMSAFLFLTIVLFSTLFVGGMVIQLDIDNALTFNLFSSIICTVICFGITLIFRDRFIFYNRIKINNTIMIFLAIIQKQKGNN